MKNFLRHTLLLLIAVILMTPSIMKAQDIHFSQYNSSPLLLSPAMAGMNAGDYRVYANFRTQWMTVSNSNTYRTFAGGADMAVGKVTRYNSFAGFGISFFADQSGAVRLNTNHVDLSFAYHFMLNRKGSMQLSAGLQGSFNYKSFDPSRATFDSQYDFNTGQADPNSTGENFGRNKVVYGDAGFGLLYSALTRNETNIYFGVAVNHVNQPKVSFYPNGLDGNVAGRERMYMKVTLHGGASIPVGKRLFIMPNYMVLVQGPAYEFNVGCNFKTVVGNPTLSKTAVHFGMQYRGLYDAVIFNTRVDIKGFSCGLSYDVNISKLMPASKTIGAPEIALTYQGAFRKKPRPGHCPAMF
ncbi:MAG: PorP/SprF family type IX secretion system membrane protein [Chitinophagales bacterium]